MVKKGADLTGEPATSPLFPFDWKPAVASHEKLLALTVWRRKALQTRAGDGESHGGASRHEVTLEEVKLGHLSGPFTEAQLDQKFGPAGWLFNKRFASHQGTPENPKVRVIDGCKISGLNCAYTTTNKLELKDVDVLACALMAISRCALNWMRGPWRG